MTRNIVTFALAATLSLAAAAGAEAQAIKIGVVNFGKLLEESPQAKSAQQALENEFLPRQRDVAAQQKSLQDKREKLQKEAAVMGLFKAPFFAQPNLLAGRAVVPELAQADVNPERLGRELERWLDEPEAVAELEALFTAIHRQLQRGASGQAADAILSLARREAP